MNTSLRTYWLGRRDYAPTLQLMQDLVTARRKNQIQDMLLLLEHAPVITLGRGAKLQHILEGKEELERIGIQVVETGRGGDVTLHAPGQLIAYPIVFLPPGKQDVRKYVRALTHTMNELIAPFGLQGGTKKDLIGLWLDREQPQNWPGEEHAQRPAKIGAIGVRINRWVTSHGFALNLSTDLSLFDLIVPCGIHQHGVTSVAQLSKNVISTREAAKTAGPLLAEKIIGAESAEEDLSSLRDDELRDLCLQE